MNKQTLIKKIIARLQGEIEAYVRAAQAAHAESTHEQSKAENKYDTRGLEASYLAHGQSRQAGEVELAIAAFESMEVRAFGVTDSIDVGALVELAQAGRRMFYFMGHRGGGMDVEHEDQEVLVITPQSPLGRQLQGKKQGDLVQFSLGGERTQYRVVTVW
jgi:hypothetical protein